MIDPITDPERPSSGKSRSLWAVAFTADSLPLESKYNMLSS